MKKRDPQREPQDWVNSINKGKNYYKFFTNSFLKI